MRLLRDIGLLYICMETIGFGYRRDGSRIFWNEDEVKGADARSFVLLNETWARDDKHVYVSGRPQRKADAPTFRVLDEVYAKDAGTVLTVAGPLPEADASSFEALGPGTSQGYGRDGHHVFHYVRTIGRPRALKNADPSSFRVIASNAITGCFGRDNERVYCESNLLPNADPASWRALGSGYSRDNLRAYFWNRRLPEVDLASFEVLPAGTPHARDKNRYYEAYNVIERSSYFERLARLSVLHGIVQDARMVDRDGNSLDDESPLDYTQGYHYRIEIECRRWLRRAEPACGVALGSTTRLVIERHVHRIPIAKWRGRSWLWFLHYDEKTRQLQPGTCGFTPINSWEHCSPESELSFIESLLVEVEPMRGT
jgi:hypothetical protein